MYKAVSISSKSDRYSMSRLSSRRRSISLDGIPDLKSLQLQARNQHRRGTAFSGVQDAMHGSMSDISRLNKPKKRSITLRIGIFGEDFAGKSALSTRICSNRFIYEYLG